MISLLETGYTNQKIVIASLNYFIKHTEARLNKLWKFLLLDSHITHENPDFVILAYENHIKPIVTDSVNSGPVMRQ